jgi:hypothetical protein
VAQTQAREALARGRVRGSVVRVHMARLVVGTLGPGDEPPVHHPR